MPRSARGLGGKLSGERPDQQPDGTGVDGEVPVEALDGGGEDVGVDALGMAHHERGDRAIGRERGEQCVGRGRVGEVHLVVGERDVVGSPVHARVVGSEPGGDDLPSVIAKAVGDRGRDACLATHAGDKGAAGHRAHGRRVPRARHGAARR